MNIAAVIAEYNPFHKGHSLHLALTKKITNADGVIAVISGNYVQRGAPAMFDKYTRAHAALLNGADLVLELPLCAACGSAEYFARGSIFLLNQTGIVTDLCFGSECGDLKALDELSQILVEEPEDYKSLLRHYLKAGESFPKARMLALSQYDSSISLELLNKPNNLLALEYLKALKRSHSSIRPHTILRRGNAYYEDSLTPDSNASANAIRSALVANCGNFTENHIKVQLPAWELYADYQGKQPITENAFSLLLLQKLRKIQNQPLDQYFDVGKELSNRIWNHLDDFTSFCQFTDILKTKDQTRTAVSRALFHILLDIREYQPAHFFNVLGFRKESSFLLKELSLCNNLPIKTNLSDSSLDLAEQYPDHLYESVRSLLHHRPFQNEYRRKMLVC